MNILLKYTNMILLYNNCGVDYQVTVAIWAYVINGLWDLKFIPGNRCALPIVGVWHIHTHTNISKNISANINRRSKPTSTYMASNSQCRLSICSSLLFYRERIGQILIPLCPLLGGETHTSVQLLLCPSHPTSLTVKDLWEHPRLASEFFFGPTLFDFPPLSSPKPPPSNGH